jgi:hypothetical protein
MRARTPIMPSAILSASAQIATSWLQLTRTAPPLLRNRLHSVAAANTHRVASSANVTAPSPAGASICPPVAHAASNNIQLAGSGTVQAKKRTFWFVYKVDYPLFP